MDFRIDAGPWQTIFDGKFLGHAVEIVTNPEKYFLAIVYDEANGEKRGAMVEGYKALVANGALDSFIQTLPKPCLGITKNSGDNTSKMLFISFEPLYIDLKEEDFTRRIDNAIKKSYENIETIKELARASSIQLKEISLSPAAEYAPILNDPLAARLLLSGLKKSALQMLDLSDHTISRKKASSIQLGLSKTREIIKEDGENFYRTIITGDGPSVLYANYILAENFLLDDTNIIIFDSNNYFSGLGHASKHEKELKDAMIDFEPAGFPLKEFKAKDNFKISFKEVDFGLMSEMLKISDKAFEEKVIGQKFNFDNAKEIAENVSELKELSAFQKLKLERIMQIIDKKFGGLFGQSIDTKDLMKKWPGNLGRATIINTADLTGEEKIIFAQTTVRLLKDTLGDKIEGNTIFILPQSDIIFSYNRKKFVDDLISLENKGIGLILGNEKEIPELVENSSAQIKIVKGNDVAIATKKNRNYRVSLRPSLSGEPQLNKIEK
jgi:hypothetical protein